MGIRYQRTSVEAVGADFDPHQLLTYADLTLPDAWQFNADLLQSPAMSRIVYPNHVDLLLQRIYFRIMDLAEAAGGACEPLGDLA